MRAAVIALTVSATVSASAMAMEAFTKGSSHHWDELTGFARLYGKTSRLMRLCKLDTKGLQDAYVEMLVRARIPQTQFDALSEIVWANDYGSTVMPNDCKKVPAAADRVAKILGKFVYPPPGYE